VTETRADSAASPLRCKLGQGPAAIGVALVMTYRYTLGVLFPTTCKYHPSCSQYAIDAVKKHGLVKGLLMAGWRLLRCNPWSHGGVDYP
jgi:uncharacterized protein